MFITELYRLVYDSYSFVAAFLLALSIYTCPHVSPGGESQRRSRGVRMHTFINPVRFLATSAPQS